MPATAEKLKVRNVHFDFSNVKKHWLLSSAIATHFINSMHIVFPEGEKFFIRSVRRFADEIKDPQLRKDIKTFSGQEGIHSREHERFWEIMEAQGLKPKGFADFLKVTAFSGKYSFENMLVNGLNKVKPRLGDKIALSTTTALEHFTAILAHGLFHDPIITDKNAPTKMMELMLWHASEEIEHKAVCFDVLKEVDDSYIIRVSGMGIASVMLASYLSMGHIYFVVQDKDKSLIRMPIESFMLFKTIVFGEIGKNFAKHYLSYFKKDFHPDDIDDRHLSAEFFKNKTYA